MTVGEQLQFYRKQQNLSQEELAKQLLVTRQTVSLWETDQTLPTVDNLIRIKDIFGVSIDDILTGETDKTANITDIQNSAPLEIYSFSHTPQNVRTVNRIKNWSHVQSSVFAAIILLWLLISGVVLVLSKTVLPSLFDFIIGILFGCFVILIIKNILYFVKYRTAVFSQDSITYEFYGDYLRSTVKRYDTVISTNIITPGDIDRCLETKEYFIFEYSRRLYYIKKSIISDSSALPTFFGKVKGFKSFNKVKNLKNTARLLSAASVIIVIAVLLCTFLLSRFSLLSDKDVWKVLFLLPVPITLIIIGIILNKKGVKNIANIVIGIIMSVVLVLYSFIYFFGIDNKLYQYGDKTGFTVGAEEVTADFISIDISWIRGSVTVMPYDGESVKLEETAVDDDDHVLRWRLADGVLIIEPCGFGIDHNNVPEKNLTVYLPESLAQTVGKIEIDTSFADINLMNIKADTVNLDVSFGNIKISGCECNYLDMDVAFGNVYCNDFSANTVQCDAGFGNATLNAAILPNRLDITAGSIIEVRLPQNDGFTALINSSRGRIISDFELTKIGNMYVYGDGTAVYTFESGYDISIKEYKPI